MKNSRIDNGILVVFFLIYILAITLIVFADTQTTTVTFQIPSSVSHSIAYAGTCSNSNFAFIENDASIDGTENAINVTTTASAVCQTQSIPALNISNTGNVVINVTANFTAALPTGVKVKASQGTGGWQSNCASSGPPTSTTCVNITTVPVLIMANVPATGTDFNSTWMWADFASADMGGGVGQAGSTTRDLTTIAVQY